MTAKSASLPNKECTVDVTGKLVECRYQGYACKAVEPKSIVLENTLLKQRRQYYRGHGWIKAHLICDTVKLSPGAQWSAWA